MVAIDLTLKQNSKFTVLTVSNQDNTPFDLAGVQDTVNWLLKDPAIQDPDVINFRDKQYYHVYIEFLTAAAGRCTVAVDDVDKLLNGNGIVNLSNLPRDSVNYKRVPEFDEIYAFSIVKYNQKIIN